MTCRRAPPQTSPSSRLDPGLEPGEAGEGRCETPTAEPAPHALTAGRLWDRVKHTAVLDRAAARLSVPLRAAGPVRLAHLPPSPFGLLVQLPVLHPRRQVGRGAEPRGEPEPVPEGAPTIVETDGLKVWFPIKRGLLRRTVGHVKAVNHANIAVRAGETVGIVGRNGCGKSTLLNLVAGLDAPTSGVIRIDGQKVNHLSPRERDVAMVFQSYALYPHLSVYDNIAFGLKLAKVPKDEIDRRVKDAAQVLGLEGFLKRKPRALAGGQRQRVAMGRAIVRQPQVFLFDEPLSNLDAKLRAQTRI